MECTGIVRDRLKATVFYRQWPSLVFILYLNRGFTMGILIYDKPFKTYNEQITHLKNDYGLSIVDVDFAKYILSTFSYYDIINGYQECMMINGKFREGINIDYLFFFHLFDKGFQNIIFKNSLVIETSFKTKLAAIIAKNYGVDMNDYLDKKNFKYTYKGKIFFPKVKQEILKGIRFWDNHTNKYIYTNQPTKHYFEHHNHIPPWILLKNISFGNAINLYCLLKPSDKEEVSASIITADIPINLKMAFITSSVNLIRAFRNVIAHNLKFVTFKQNQYLLPFHTTKLLINDELLTKDIKNFNNVYACILAIYILLDHSIMKTKLLYDIYKLISDNPCNSEEYKTLQALICNDYFSITELGPNFIDKLMCLLNNIKK